MKLRLFLASSLLIPTAATAASISMDETETFGEISPTEILREHRREQKIDYSLVIPGRTSSRTSTINHWDLDKKNPQAYDWFVAGNSSAIDIDKNLQSLGTPVPEPSGTLLFGLTGLALSLRRRR